MTTFTTDDRIYAEKDGSFTINFMPKPLTDEQINDLLIPITSINIWDFPDELIKLARAIEKAHGIR